MPLSYNRIAGQSVERLAALSDGVFAVAMTLLVLDLRVPVIEAVHSEHDLWHGLAALSPRLLMYMMSFMTLGIFWIGQQDTTQPPCALRPQALVDSHPLSVHGFDYAVLDHSSRRISGISHRAGRLLGKYPASGEHALFQLGLRNGNGTSQGRLAA